MKKTKKSKAVRPETFSHILNLTDIPLSSHQMGINGMLNFIDILQSRGIDSPSYSFLDDNTISFESTRNQAINMMKYHFQSEIKEYKDVKDKPDRTRHTNKKERKIPAKNGKSTTVYSYNEIVMSHWFFKEKGVPENLIALLDRAYIRNMNYSHWGVILGNRFNSAEEIILNFVDVIFDAHYKNEFTEVKMALGCVSKNQDKQYLTAHPLIALSTSFWLYSFFPYVLKDVKYDPSDKTVSTSNKNLVYCYPNISNLKKFHDGFKIVFNRYVSDIEENQDLSYPKELEVLFPSEAGYNTILEYLESISSLSELTEYINCIEYLHIKGQQGGGVLAGYGTFPVNKSFDVEEFNKIKKINYRYLSKDKEYYKTDYDILISKYFLMKSICEEIPWYRSIYKAVHIYPHKFFEKNAVINNRIIEMINNGDDMIDNKLNAAIAKVVSNTMYYAKIVPNIGERKNAKDKRSYDDGERRIREKWWYTFRSINSKEDFCKMFSRNFLTPRSGLSFQDMILISDALFGENGEDVWEDILSITTLSINVSNPWNRSKEDKVVEVEKELVN